MAPSMNSTRCCPLFLADGGERMSNGLDLASARCLQQPQALARDLLRALIALPLVIEFEPRPFGLIDGLAVGSPELAVRRRLRYQQCPSGPVNSPFRAFTGWRGGGRRYRHGFRVDVT